MFSKGFSTKSSDTSSGLGLHWCTNVLQAMDGKLWAESEGPDLGTTCHLELPFP
ncbi:ATP-binding protein [Synechococcus sp. CCY 9618]|uniref:ATP-binding protein n=1 Tax=Synechococcus sp. CCY 9618 TaxID=2815602 RepID=UPI00352CA027